MKKYAILHKKSNKLMTFSTTANDDGEFCTSVEYSIELYSPDEPIWMVDTREKAEYVANTDTAWYNAGYDTPRNSYAGEELEVVEIKISIS